MSAHSSYSEDHTADVDEIGRALSVLLATPGTYEVRALGAEWNGGSSGSWRRALWSRSMHRRCQHRSRRNRLRAQGI